MVWELNRHQHLTLLAQAFRLTGRREYLQRAAGDLESWFEANPYGRGINWASALEVAFRAVSWIWIYHLAGESMDARFRREFLTGLFRHGCYLEKNLSVYFSPNTHLLGEAVALHALGALFPGFPRARRWERRGLKIAAQQLTRQVREDGSHFEQSSYYHLYALDMFLFHYLLAGRPPGFRPRLELMAVYLDALMGPQRSLPFFGDEDGGRSSTLTASARSSAGRLWPPAAFYLAPGVDRRAPGPARTGRLVAGRGGLFGRRGNP